MTGEQNVDLTKIIKRLELIKSLISLEEEGEINVHVSKLQQHDLTGEVESIVIALNEKSYSKAAAFIETFISKHHNLTIYIDPEIDGLKLEIKSLETQLNALSDEKADVEKLIHEFGVRHNHELGELIIKILNHRKEKAKGTPQQQEAENDYNSYNKEFEATKDEHIAILTEEEQKELKSRYRKASKLCHPDVVSEAQKELATKLFAELSIAYEKNDLNRVKEILENLEKGNFFVSKSDTINEKQLLYAEMEKLRLLIQELKNELAMIRESEAYSTVTKIDNWDTYFSNTKQRLETELKELET